jgi:hypothetical protein
VSKKPDLEAPSGLSARSGALWDRLHADKSFSPDAEDLLERYLRHLDLSDVLFAKANEEGLTTAGGHRALASARDALQTGLKLLHATGLSKLDAEAARHPSDAAWSVKRRPRDPLTGRVLRSAL